MKDQNFYSQLLDLYSQLLEKKEYTLETLENLPTTDKVLASILKGGCEDELEQIDYQLFLLNRMIAAEEVIPGLSLFEKVQKADEIANPYTIHAADVPTNGAPIRTIEYTFPNGKQAV